MKKKQIDYRLLSQIELRQLVEKEIKNEVPDWVFIEQVSSHLVDSNSQDIRFKVDAGHIQRLGFELVSKQETALIELIKNAYDADATTVNIQFIKSDEKNGTLIIEDNGVGMDIDTIKHAWMNISTDYKRINDISPRYGRIRSGRKGIGRFAVQRLGKKLEIRTATSGQLKGVSIFFNWDVDFQSGTNLRDIFSHVEYYDKDIDYSGTILKIYELREIWTEAQLKRAWKGVITLQAPIKSLKVDKNLLCLNDPGFEVIINGIGSKQKNNELSIQASFLDSAVASISAQINADGTASVNVKSRKLQLEEQYLFEEKFLLTGELNLTAEYFIYASELMSGINLKTAQTMSADYGGIRIYRDGFRVLPYGERSDDWLALDRDTSRRNLLVPGANTNFFGKVYLTSKNILFEETSSREGLLENEAFAELTRFVRNSLEWAILRVASARNRKQTAGQKGFTSELLPIKKPSDLIENLEESLINFTDTLNETPEIKKELIKKHIKYVKSEIQQFEEKINADKASLLEYNEMLRILASLGISIAIFGHEIKGGNAALNGGLNVLALKANKIENPMLKDEIIITIQGLQSVAGRIFNIGNYIGQVMSHTESRELKSLSLRGSIIRFFEQFSDYLTKQKIEYELNLPNINIRTIPMHASELDSVLLNFLTNSVKALKKAKSNNAKIKITISMDSSFAILHFEDNGVGVAKQDQGKIFEAFYTTNIEPNDEILEGVGTGLGLKIVADIASSYGGSVKLINASSSYRCCFEFKVLKKKIEEIK